MFIRQPVVSCVVVLEFVVHHAALFSSVVPVRVLTLVSVTHLELVVGARAKPSTVSRAWIVTRASAELHASSAGLRTGTKLAPQTPVPILFYDVRGQPHTVPFKTVLAFPTGCAVNRGSFLGLAEEWVVWVSAPQLLTWVIGAVRCAHHVSGAEVEAALLVHGVVQAGQLGKLLPRVLKRVVSQTVIGV